MRYFLFCIAVVLSGCSASNPTVHTFNEDQNFSMARGTDVRMVRWIRLSHDELQKTCAKLTGMRIGNTDAFMGCATPSPTGTCIIYTSTDTTHQILGHEVRHCFQGNFHK